MSRIALEGNVSGTGVFTLASPNGNTNRTLNLPDSAGTLLHDASSLAAANLTGTIAKARLPAGSVLQVVQNSSNTQYSTTSTSYQAATNHNVTITPSSASSKILIMHQGMVNHLASSTWCFATIYRGATNLYTGGSQDAAGGIYNGGTTPTSDGHCPMTFVYLDSPNTTSSVTYTVYFKANTGNTIRYNADGWKLYFVAMEIAG